MRNLFRILTLCLVLIAVMVPSDSQGQATTTATYLSSAATINASTIVVNAATVSAMNGFFAGNIVYIDREAMTIAPSYTSGTTIPVIRGTVGTANSSHASASNVYVGPPQWFGRASKFGSCAGTPADSLNTPVVNVNDGYLYYCANGEWQSFSIINRAEASPYRQIQDVAYTAVINDEFIDYVNLGTGRTVTLPALTGVQGKRIIITNGTTNTSTITVAASAGHNIGPGAGSSSTTFSGAGAALRLVSTGTGWHTW